MEGDRAIRARKIEFLGLEAVQYRGGSSTRKGRLQSLVSLEAQDEHICVTRCTSVLIPRTLGALTCLYQAKLSGKSVGKTGSPFFMFVSPARCSRGLANGFFPRCLCVENWQMARTSSRKIPDNALQNLLKNP